MSELNLDHIFINVEPSYQADHSDPKKDKYVFSYKVRIENRGKLPAKLMSRHWIITDANGRIKEVLGRGVVGEQPELEPGEFFEYTSWAMLETPFGSMEGSYQLVRNDGEEFETEIPAFTLSLPKTLH